MRTSSHGAWHPPLIFWSVDNTAAVFLMMSKSQANFPCGADRSTILTLYLELGRTSQVKAYFSRDCPRFRHSLQTPGFLGHNF